MAVVAEWPMGMSKIAVADFIPPVEKNIVKVMGQTQNRIVLRKPPVVHFIRHPEGIRKIVQNLSDAAALTMPTPRLTKTPWFVPIHATVGTISMQKQIVIQLKKKAMTGKKG
jgi:hypothetical protein